MGSDAVRAAQIIGIFHKHFRSAGAAVFVHQYSNDTGHVGHGDVDILPCSVEGDSVGAEGEAHRSRRQIAKQQIIAGPGGDITRRVDLPDRASDDVGHEHVAVGVEGQRVGEAFHGKGQEESQEKGQEEKEEGEEIMDDMKFRWPDDPNRISFERLQEIQEEYGPGAFIAQPKWDGWRRPAYFYPNGWKFYAKRGDGGEAKRQPPSDLVEEFKAMNWPKGIALDMEWIGPRCVSELHERYGVKGYNGFHIFDILYIEGEWVGTMPFLERLKNLATIFALATKGEANERIQIVPHTDSEMVAMFQGAVQDPLLEGIVLRRARSKLVGHPTKASKNPQMMKVKYRDIKEDTLF